MGYLAAIESDFFITLLEKANRNHSGLQFIKETALQVKDQSGLGVVAVRLKDGEDYPYIFAQGFPRDFLATENCLCKRDAEGNTVKDIDGQPALECMCGNVIRDRCDTGHSFFTERGSFWTNDLGGLSRHKKARNWMENARNTCAAFGYNSVALIPIANNGQKIGLIQLNDQRMDCFSEEYIRGMEGVADCLGAALCRAREERLIREQKKLQAAILTVKAITREVNHPLMTALEYIDLELGELTPDSLRFNSLMTARKQLLNISSIMNRVGRIIDFNTEQSTAENQIGNSNTSGKQKKILVVDDEKAVVTFLEGLLVRNGFDFFGVNNSQSALTEIDNNRYDLILLDLKIGRENGAELCRKIRKKCPQTPIICLSGSVTKEQTEALFKAGFTAVEEKPIRNKKLVSLIESFVSNS